MQKGMVILMKTEKKQQDKKQKNLKPYKKIIGNLLQLLFFFVLMALTFHTIFSKNDIADITSAMHSLNPLYFIAALCSAILFVCGEGFMIWYLLLHAGNETKLFHCFGYSFIGFFFSGITPSATGGQPAQLIFMKRDGLPIADSTLTLMTVAVLYKFVLVIIGVLILFFWKEGLALYLGSYMGLYYLGILLNTVLVIILLLVMFHGKWMETLLLQIEKLCVKLHLCKPSVRRAEAFHKIITDYQHTLHFFIRNKAKIAFVALCTFLQRCCLFVLTYFIYRGLGLNTYGALLITVLQASVYIAVDMLPLPGSQGISELMYHAVFTHIFTAGCLTASMCITRGISFYFLLMIGAVISFLRFILLKRKTNYLGSRSFLPDSIGNSMCGSDWYQ